MAIILPNNDNNDQAKSYFERFIKQAKIEAFLHQANIRKESGIFDNDFVLYQS